jgi:hypothetical protein
MSEAWGGVADFLMRIDTPSALGPWSYEALDTKLARHAKPACRVAVRREFVGDSRMTAQRYQEAVAVVMSKASLVADAEERPRVRGR